MSADQQQEDQAQASPDRQADQAGEHHAANHVQVIWLGHGCAAVPAWAAGIAGRGRCIAQPQAEKATTVDPTAIAPTMARDRLSRWRSRMLGRLARVMAWASRSIPRRCSAGPMSLLRRGLNATLTRRRDVPPVGGPDR